MPRATVRIRVPFVDVDSSDRIHYTAVMRYWEVAEHALMRGLGLPYATALREVAFPRVHVSADFKGGILFDDELEVEARIERVGATSWTVAFAARRADMGADAPTLAQGRMTIVAMDPATERAMPLPAELRRALIGDDA
ncbi:MAG TPA: thioesterase family protein [Ktedonobacterales bacterium]|jgi:YbgC/YbaW family acyl-CoA thioester hydrolase|nr:thioesterase family protein [Ktedonobacterales bacterium]